jgi:alkaline phosphatase D
MGRADSRWLRDVALRRLSRRQLLDLGWRLGVAAWLHPLASRTALAQPAFTSYPFTLGVASGDPWPDGVVLWTRLAPDPLNGGGMPMANAPVAWEVAHDEHFTSLASTGQAIARPELGHSVHVEVGGLEPGREYWYRFHAGRETSITGRTRTAAAPGAAVDQVRFAVCGCTNFEMGYFTALGHLADQQFDFVFHTGDYIYEGGSGFGRAKVGSLPRLHRGEEIFTLVDYRNRYAQYKMDPDLTAAHASAPFVVSWDDHEVDNDYAGDVDDRDTPPEIFLLRRAAAYQAYFEALPLRASSIPRGPSLRLYRHLQFGNLVDLSVLDTRQHRSDQVCEQAGARSCEAATAADRTMLGVEQERWLFDHLAEVRATWTVIGQQVPMFAQQDAPVGGTMDKWDGYPAARGRLLSRLVDTRAPNPIVLSGDVHVHFGADLKLDFGDPASPTVGTELTNSSISSGGDGAEVADYWERLKQRNPHMRFHSGRRGYISCTATPRALRADFIVVDRVTVRGAPPRRAGALVVEAGRRGAQDA